MEKDGATDLKGASTGVAGRGRGRASVSGPADRTCRADRAAPAEGAEPPDWWPYASEFPHWHVWRGIAGLLYARRLMSSPPRVVRSQDAGELRDQIRQAELRL